MIHLTAWGYFWLTISAMSFGWWIWFTVHTFRKIDVIINRKPNEPS